MTLRKTTGRRAADTVNGHYDQVIAEQLIKRLGREFKLEELRGRLRREHVGENEWLILDGQPLIEFFPPRLTEEHRNGSHFLKLELPYRLFDWELAP